MRLTKHTDYAFRVLLYLAARPEGQRSTANQIATDFNISADHITKVVQKLARAGLINSTRGRNGGLTIRCDPNKLTLDKVVTLMETTLTPANCLEPPCVIRGDCQLAQVLSQASDAFVNHLANFTLEDLVQSSGQLVTLANQKTH